MDQFQSWCNQMQMGIDGIALAHTRADTSLGCRASGGSKPHLTMPHPRAAKVSRSRLLSHHFPVTCYLLPKSFL